MPDEDAVLLRLDSVYKRFRQRRGGVVQTVIACNDVSFEVKTRRIVALVGESGSGKSTIARLITGVERVDSGHITVADQQVERLSRRALRTYRRNVQMVFQDPYAALNPLNTVRYTIGRPLINYAGMKEDASIAKVRDILETVHLTPPDEFLEKLPFELSGGQLQRVVIGRAIAASPKLIVADEPVSMLDVSIRAEVLQLLAELRDTQGVTILYITHDLLSAHMIADDMIVLYRGRVVETGDVKTVISRPTHPYTQLLMASLPNPWSERDRQVGIPTREPAHGDQPRAGCVFQDRCPYALPRCQVEEPILQPTEDGRTVACHYADVTSGKSGERAWR
ncbi:MAG: ABC transporter ATP-binding protein [Firmicutes bacterium]|nr:ABC transporter ATP-binding protein [Bacillota bacterium]